LYILKKSTVNFGITPARKEKTIEQNDTDPYKKSRKKGAFSIAKEQRMMSIRKTYVRNSCTIYRNEKKEWGGRNTQQQALLPPHMA